MSETPEKFETWGLVEVMGHQRYAGLITEQTVGGAAFVRVDVPAFEDRPAFTKLLGSGSIFAITPTTEQVARGIAQRLQNPPIHVWDIPRPHQHALSYDEQDDD